MKNVLILMLWFTLVLVCRAKYSALDYAKGLTLEELMNVEISTGNLSGVKAKSSPSAITTITKEEIQLTTARNLATLLEIYVPGMMLMTHQEGDKIGIRGLIAAENYKLLLLLNGRNITNMVYEGAFLELDLWDMNDIEKIEIIRGPGSVTYGTGAIAGVINIITKKNNGDEPMLSVGSVYDPEYRSYGSNIQYSEKIGDLGIYSYLSYRKSLGQQSPDYYSMTTYSKEQVADPEYTENRYLGKRFDDTAPPQAYLGDALDKPQLKAHIDLNYGKNFRIWSRYTQSGQTHYFTTQAEKKDNLGNVTETVNGRQLTLRSFAVSPEYTYELNDDFKIKTNIIYDNQEYIRYQYARPDFEIDNSNNIRNYAFSQERIEGSLLFDYQYADKFKLVTGYTFNRTAVVSPWGKSADYLWVQEGTHIISNKETSVYLNDTNSQFKSTNNIEEVGEGIFVNTHSYLLETSYKFADKYQLLFSSRLDFPDISVYLWSPRLSFISEINKKNTLKITAQSSMRMMPIRAQYLFNKYQSRDTTKNDNEHENLNSLEIGYNYLPNKNTMFEFHAFYNDIDAVGYTGEDLQFLGDIQLFGFDLEGTFAFEKTSLKINHSYLMLIDMKMNEALKTGGSRNNISFSDYYYNTRSKIQDGVLVTVPLLLESFGNGLNNWSKNTTRFIITHKILDEKLIFHANARVFWDYAGAYDEMAMYENAYENFNLSNLSQEQREAFDQEIFDNQKAIFERERDLLEKQDPYSLDIRLNVSLSYKWDIADGYELFTTAYADNFIGSRKRYFVSTGSKNPVPERLKWVEEPRTFGLKLQINFK
jgi:outer membrane receptor protein involved in Fe transport